jgi:hypothetical protein
MEKKIIKITVAGADYVGLSLVTLLAQKGVHRSAMLVFLGNKSLIRASRRERAVPLAPHTQTYRNRAN